MGVDIGTTAVKVAVLRSTYRKTSLVALASCDVADAGGPVAAAQRAAQEAMAKIKSGTDGIGVAIDGSRVAVRMLSLPASAQKQLNDVLAFELEAQVPFDMETSIFDYRLLASPKGGELSVLAAVARIDDVRARIDIVKEALKQEPERVAVGAFPLANLASVVPALAEPGPVVVLDLGTRSSEVLVLRAGEPAFARTLSFGTEGLPQSAARLAREIRVTLAAYRAQGGEAASRIFLCGGGAFVSGAEHFLSAELEIPVEIVPAPGLDVAELDPARHLELPRFAKAVGLALGLGRGAGLNLRRGPLAYERGFAWVRDKVPILAGLAAVILVSFVFAGWARLYSLGKEHDALAGALGDVTKQVLGEETEDPARAQELITQQTAINDEDPMPHADAFDVMVKLSEAIPPSMTHDVEELDVNRTHVTLHGIVGSIPDAQAIQAALHDERCFQDVKIGRTSQQPGGDRQKYVMEWDVKCPEDVKGTTKKKGAAGAGGGGDTAAGAPSASGTGGK
jgi:general secretion pathway protein L